MAKIALLISMLALSTSYFLTQKLLPVYPIFTLLFLRFMIGSIYFVAISNKLDWENIRRSNAKQCFLFFMQAICGGVLYNTLLVYGLSYTTTNHASIINLLIPFIIIIFSIIFLKEKPHRWIWLCIFLSIFGIYLLTAHSVPSITRTINSKLIGDTIILVGVFFGAMYPIFLRQLGGYFTIKQLSIGFNVIGFIAFIPLLFTQQHIISDLPSVRDAFFLIVYSILTNIVYVHAWNSGLSKIKANVAALFIGLLPLFTMIGSVVFYSHHPHWNEVVGASCIIFSLFLVLNPSRP